jgi:16S rRNA (cytidine1402-2'-O)-methyltransferase
MLRDVRDILGDREVVLAREVTKLHEEFLRGTVSGLLDRAKGKTMRGEITLLVGAASAPGETRPPNSLIKREIEKLMAERGLDERAALKAAAKARGISRSEAYRLLQMEKAQQT